MTVFVINFNLMNESLVADGSDLNVLGIMRRTTMDVTIMNFFFFFALDIRILSGHEVLVETSSSSTVFFNIVLCSL